VASVSTDTEQVGILTTDVVQVWSESRAGWRRRRGAAVELVQWRLAWAPAAGGGVDDGVLLDPEAELDEWVRGWFVLRHRLYRLSWLGSPAGR